MRKASQLWVILLFCWHQAAAAGLSAHYECLWWSTEQMRNLDPNHPPLKTSVVRLAKWEYSDPIGVPHPDLVTLVVRVPKAEAAHLSVRTEWLGGSWSAPTILALSGAMTSDGAEQVGRYAIEIGPYIETHSPKRLRSSLYVRGVKVGDFDLPIATGD